MVTAVPFSLSAAVNLAGAASYTNNMDSGLGDFEAGYTFWQNQAVFGSGVGTITGQGAGNGLVNVTNPGSLDPSTSATPFTPSYPLASIVAPTTFNAQDSRFDGNWLITNGVGNNTSAGVPSGTGSIVLVLSNLAPHTSLNLAMVWGIGDSIDASLSSTSYDGPLQILIDGVVVYQQAFAGGGGSTGAGGFQNGASGTMTRTVSGLNTTAMYRERWQYNSGAGPTNENNRYAESWTLESIWDMAFEIAHTNSDVTIEFRHQISSGITDEFIAMDSFSVTAVPEPSRLLLSGLSLMALVGRRRR